MDAIDRSPGRSIQLAKTTGEAIRVANLSAAVELTGVAKADQRRSGAYWRDLAFSRLIPSLFFSLFLARQLLLLAGGFHGIRQPSDLLFLLQQLLGLAYFTMLVILYAVRLPQRGTDRRAYVIFVAFSGTFAAISASFLPGGVRRDGLLPVGDLLATAGLAYSVWGLAYLRRSFSIIPEARRLVIGGPYAFSRHPVYLGEVVTAIGVNIATAGWLSAIAVAYFIACELLRIHWEERVLEQSFPNEYPAYASRVPRYLPSPFRSR